MLEHAYGIDSVVTAANIPIIHQADIDRQVFFQFFGFLYLLTRYGDAGDAYTIVFGGEAGGSSPAASDVKYFHAGFEPQLVEDQPQFVFLCGIEAVGTFPVSTTVEHVPVKHGFVQVIADVVVRFTNVEGSRWMLQVDQDSGKVTEKAGKL